MTITKWIDIECDGDGCDESVEFEIIHIPDKGESPKIKEARGMARSKFGFVRAQGKDYCPKCYTPELHRNPTPEDETS